MTTLQTLESQLEEDVKDGKITEEEMNEILRKEYEYSWCEK